MRASSPLPRAFLCMVEYLPGQVAITVGTGAVGVVEHDRFPERRRLAEANVARDDAPIDSLGEELSRLVRDLLGKIEAGVVHGEQHAFDPQARVELILDPPDRPDELGQAF